MGYKQFCFHCGKPIPVDDDDSRALCGACEASAIEFHRTRKPDTWSAHQCGISVLAGALRWHRLQQQIKRAKDGAGDKPQGD